jgi:hypothetical protein
MFDYICDKDSEDCKKGHVWYKWLLRIRSSPPRGSGFDKRLSRYRGVEVMALHGQTGR